ncbi:MAG: hypothetical protein DMG51_01260 [Acidobacteria bacterium]|nr:MAG: hypothetical protein DMG51_01260 [Acidobacteriota bacterium]
MAFRPVTTSAVRVEAQLDESATAGIFEWRLNDESKHVDAVTDLRAKESFQLQNNALVWTISLRNGTDHGLEIGDLACHCPSIRNTFGTKRKPTPRGSFCCRRRQMEQYPWTPIPSASSKSGDWNCRD